GLPINDILRAATITPALALKREQQIGIVAAGFTANLILLASDPRKDLSVLRNPVAVIKSGRVFNQAALAELDNKAQQHMNWFSAAIMYLWAAY
ncbi:MAG: amidohydrolase family protein, partial [Colwellia sp.]|nr:amidohydrolase family protein [Colwellia sp.]